VCVLTVKNLPWVKQNTGDESTFVFVYSMDREVLLPEAEQEYREGT
jgi:hypothetical protein